MTQDPQARPYTDAYPETAAPPPGAVAVDEVLIVEEPLPYGETGPTDQGADSSADVAKDQAAQVAGTAKDAGKQVAGTAKQEAGNVAAEAKTKAKDVLGQARTEARDQADTQKQRVSAGLQSISRELGSMADRSEEPGMATDLARQASQGAQDIASWLEQRDPGQLVDDVRSFARRRPGAFLGIALAAGVVAGRLTRGLKDDSSADEPQAQGSQFEGSQYESSQYEGSQYESSQYEGRPYESNPYGATTTQGTL